MAKKQKYVVCRPVQCWAATSNGRVKKDRVHIRAGVDLKMVKSNIFAIETWRVLSVMPAHIQIDVDHLFIPDQIVANSLEAVQ